MAQNIPELYGSLVFNDKVMRSKLPKDMYKALKKTIESGTHLELDVANCLHHRRPPVIYSQPCSPTPSTTADAPELRTAKRSPATPLINAVPLVAP